MGRPRMDSQVSAELRRCQGCGRLYVSRLFESGRTVNKACPWCSGPGHETLRILEARPRRAVDVRG